MIYSIIKSEYSKGILDNVETTMSIHMQLLERKIQSNIYQGWVIRKVTNNTVSYPILYLKVKYNEEILFILVDNGIIQLKNSRRGIHKRKPNRYIG